jgi:hypothetical protein
MALGLPPDLHCEPRGICLNASGNQRTKLKAEGLRIYSQMKAMPVINALGNVTALGGNTPSPKMREAMDAAGRYYVLPAGGGHRSEHARNPLSRLPPAGGRRLCQEGHRDHPPAGHPHHCRHGKLGLPD